MTVAARGSPLAAASEIPVSVASKSFSRNRSSTPAKPLRDGLSLDASGAAVDCDGSVTVSDLVSAGSACAAGSAAGAGCASACGTGAASTIAKAKKEATKRADTTRIAMESPEAIGEAAADCRLPAVAYVRPFCGPTSCPALVGLDV